MQDFDSLEGFQPFVRRHFRSEKTPFVTIQKRGTVSLNEAAFKALGQPTFVELLYNAERNMIAFRPISKGEKRAVPVRAFGHSSHSYILSAVTFLKDCDVDLSRSRRFPAFAKQGALVIDLNEEGDDVSGRKRQTTQGDQVPKRERDRSGMFASSSPPGDSPAHRSHSDKALGSTRRNTRNSEVDEDEAKRLLRDALAQLQAGESPDDLLGSLQERLQKFSTTKAGKQ
jgi:hypothetical protein